MTASQRVRRTGLRALAAGAVAAFLATAAPVTATAASSHGGAATRAGEKITCNSLDVDGPNVFGRDCDTDRWGPLSDFTIADRNGRAFRCRTGWAEGSLWVIGQDCRPANRED
ncbi:hypothetical protein ACH4GP_23595 [Streptomyces celluloflavus]|uniref:Secreted protein n=1 Tax=Streptomyces celluloflavus TaxID=58344 RepID=A0ABW7RH01_9ACTN